MTNWNLRIGQETEAGRIRQYNEDYIECFVPTDEAQLSTKGAIFVVADGMGGHQSGNVASREAAKHVIESYYSDPSGSVGESLVSAVKVANSRVFELSQADPSMAGMGTTLVAAVILGDRLYVANVGDSRAYLLRQKRFRQLTVDHSWVEEQVRAGILARSEAEQHPQRNLITRALGTKPRVKVDLFEVELRKGDRILLCTDGLSGQVSNGSIVQSVRAKSPSEAAASLVTQANDRGGRDNVSVVIVQAGSLLGEDFLRHLNRVSWLQNLRQRQIVALVLLILFCVCVLGLSFPIVNQRLAGEPVVAPAPAPIRFSDLHQENLGQLVTYLDYSDLDELEVANSEQLDIASLSQVELWPARSGVYMVGLVEDWVCKEQECSFGLEMADKTYVVGLDHSQFIDSVPDLDGRRVRVYGVPSDERQRVNSRLIDLGARWWAWWKPAWVTIYQDHELGNGAWVYSVVDHNPYSTIEMDDYPDLIRGEQILTKGRWEDRIDEGSMSFVVESVYHLQDEVYVPLLDEMSFPLSPTVEH